MKRPIHASEAVKAFNANGFPIQTYEPTSRGFRLYGRYEGKRVVIVYHKTRGGEGVSILTPGYSSYFRRGDLRDKITDTAKTILTDLEAMHYG